MPFSEPFLASSPHAPPPLHIPAWLHPRLTPQHASLQLNRRRNKDGAGSDSDWGSEFDADEDDGLEEMAVEADKTGQLSVVDLVHRWSRTP